MRAGTRETPVSSSGILKVNRGRPTMGSVPMRANVRPNTPPMRPLRTEPVDNVAMMVRPKIASMNFSAAPNFNEN